MPRTSAQSRSARRRTMSAATLFVVFVCVSLLAVDVWLAWRARGQELQRAMISNTNLASAVAQEMGGMVSGIDHLLEGVALELELRGTDASTLQHLLVALKKQADINKHLHGFFVYDARGWSILSTPNTVPTSANSADEAYFVHHQQHPGLSVRVGPPIVSRSTGQWIIPVSRRLNDASGHFAGVALAIIDATHVGQLLAAFNIGEEGSLTLALSDGTILARRPFAVENFGKKTAGAQLQQQILTHASGTFENVSPIDGVARLGSFQHIPDNGMLVVVALSKQELLHPWHQTTWLQTVWILILCGVTGLAGAYVVRSVRERLKIEFFLEQTRDGLTHANTRLSQLASYDALTGLANRRFFNEMIQRAFSDARRTGEPLSLVMIDVDHFKQYNDRYGHPQGDHCLQQVAQAIQAAAQRPMDFVARYGGEEMVMLLPNTDSAGAYERAESARVTIGEYEIPHTGAHSQHVSVSAGVATYWPDSQGHPRDVGELIEQADRALYRAKAYGRDCVCMHDSMDTVLA